MRNFVFMCHINARPLRNPKIVVVVVFDQIARIFIVMLSRVLCMYKKMHVELRNTKGVV